MNMPVGITLVAEFFVIAGSFQRFQNLVNNSSLTAGYKRPTAWVGILPLWPSRSEFVCRAADSFTASVQDVRINHCRVWGLRCRMRIAWRTWSRSLGFCVAVGKLTATMRAVLPWSIAGRWG